MSKVFRLCSLLPWLLMSFCVSAQEGHPLDGSWSGDRIVDGDKVRVLLVLKLLPDQVIEGTLIESGARIPVHDITLDPADWSVTFNVDGESRSGEAVKYSVEGVIENLGSATDRMITGTWSGARGDGAFLVTRN